MIRPIARCRLVTVAAGLLLMTACGKKEAPMGTVSGKVTFKGAPVSEGTVSFLSPDSGTGGEGRLTGGSYTLATPLPVGEYKVTVLPLMVRQQEDGKGPEVGVEKPAPDIPGKYRTIGTTTLKATVKEGPNESNFELTP